MSTKPVVIGASESALDRRERLLSSAKSRDNQAIEENLRRAREAEYPTSCRNYSQKTIRGW